ncbi:hypothetical protein HNQ38_001084 [Desulfovibrio intestinalis]|uniref:Uncharacterized protein n=1 Tax=Desulfovibrio intestinalis TaxID=58621 RepID=A0A7W8BZU7_9BACT|nr:hypothetical protein [Desulfovibrio intestinalis]
MPHQIGELQPPMAGDLKDRIVEPGCQLFDATCFATTCGAEDIERFMCPLCPLKIYEPDHHVAARLMEDIVVINCRGVGRRNGIAPDRGARGLAAENLTGIKVGGLKRVKFRNIRAFHYCLQKQKGAPSWVRLPVNLL